MRQHRLAGQPAFDVGGQRLRGCIASRRVLVHGAGDHLFEVGTDLHRARLFAAARQHRADRRRRAVANGAFRLGRAQPIEHVRTLAGQQLVQQHAQRIHVGSGGQRLPAHVLGAGVGRRHRGEFGRLWRRVGVLQGACDAEVEQLGFAVAGDQDVVRLQVAMHDQVPVRLLHAGADLQEQSQARAQVEPVAFAVVDQRAAVDELHRQPRDAGLGAAAVEDAGDVGMLQARQQDPFLVEAGQHQLAEFG